MFKAHVIDFNKLSFIYVSLESVPIVNELFEVFPNDLPKVFPNRERDFEIDVLFILNLFMFLHIE